MLLRRTPILGPRYWTAILVASMCGANLGDVFPDVLHFGLFTSLAIELLIFAVIVVVDRLGRRGFEGSYWLCILAVRAAATNIADYSIHDAHLTFAVAALGFAVVLALLVAFQLRGHFKGRAALPPTDILYWLTMLTAGTLGTLLGDWGAHSQESVVLGVLVSVGLASLALTLALILRSKLFAGSVVMYWVAIVSVRWWGTNMGDIVAHMTTLFISLALTAVFLLMILTLWRPSQRDAEPAV